MGRVYDALNDQQRAFLERQAMFFVATAPLDADGHVNVSPKGLQGSFSVVDPHRVAYLDLTGSGAETIAHVRENGRVTLMFCAFEGPPRIIRLHGVGRVRLPGDEAYAELEGRFPSRRNARAIIDVDVRRISDSCGYQVPLMSFVAERTQLDEWTDKRDDEAIAAYHVEKNSFSIDGLPALAPSPDAGVR